MKIIKTGRIPKPENDPEFNSNFFPCICVLPSGRWLAGYRAARLKGDCPRFRAVMTYSDDEGNTWSAPKEAVTLPDVSGVPGQSRTIYFKPLEKNRVLAVINWVDSSTLELPYYDPSDESLKDTRIFFCFSEDGGETWSAPELMDTDPVRDPVPLTGEPLMLADGTIICQFEINKRKGDLGEWVHRSAMIFSRDGGRHWGDVSIVTEEPRMYYWDQRPAVLSDGRSIIDFFWTFDGVSQKYSSIHSRRSRDGGHTWGPIRDTGICGQPGQPAVIDDGRLLTIEIDRTERPVISVRLSSDEGKTFGESLVIFDANSGGRDSKSMSMNGAWDEMAGFAVGHPGLCRLGGNRVIAYFYAGEHKDFTHIWYKVLEIY